MTSSPAINVYQDHLNEQPPGTLVQVVYSSYALTGPESDAEILRVSRRNNQAAGVTGLLIRDGDWFMQILEGPVEVVPPLMRRIEADSRHRDVSIRMVRFVAKRRFGDWTMCSPAIGHGTFEALVASLDQPEDATDQIVSDFIRDGTWPSRLVPRRRLGAALRPVGDDHDAGTLRYVICASLLPDDCCGGPDQAMVEDWWRQNADHDITGMLVHDDGNLLFYLEGNEQATEQARQSLASDTRHVAVVTLLEGETASRLFADRPLEVRSKDRPLFDDGTPKDADPELLRSLAALLRGMR